MREMAEEEIASAHQALDTLLSRTVPPLLLPPLPSSSLSCILEVKAGAGGDEAALFTEEIRSMYLKFAQAQGWKAKVLSETEQGIKGIRESHIEIKGDGAYGKLRWEGGVHRVQRIPVTESKGRMQTSTMAVIVSSASLSASCDT
jgi:peptide chain release factor 1